MRKVIFYAYVVILMFNLSGCKSNYLKGLTNDIENVSIHIGKSEDYLVKNIFINDKEILDNPRDIACDQDYLYIVNQNSCGILLYDFNGELVKSYNKVGQGEGEFLKPEAITVTDNNIYVVEQDSCRIQIFNKDFEFIKEIRISKFEKDSSIMAMDIEVVNDEIYLSVMGFSNNSTKIYKINDKGIINEIGEGLIGVFGRDSINNIYYTQSYEIYKDGVRSGLSFIAKIVDDKLSIINVLPDKYTPTSICVDGDSIFTYSYANCEIDEFTTDGTFVKTLFLEIYSNEDLILNNSNWEMTHMTYSNDTFYMTDSDDNVVYSFTPKGE